MRDTIRRVFSLWLAILVLLGTWSLGVGAAPDQKIKLRFANWQWTEPGFKDFYSEVKQEFERVNPNVEIEPYSLPETISTRC